MIVVAFCRGNPSKGVLTSHRVCRRCLTPCHVFSMKSAGNSPHSSIRRLYAVPSFPNGYSRIPVCASQLLGTHPWSPSHCASPPKQAAVTLHFGLTQLCFAQETARCELGRWRRLTGISCRGGTGNEAVAAANKKDDGGATGEGCAGVGGYG